MRNTKTLRDMTACGQGFLAPRPESVLEDHLFLAVCGYLLILFEVALLSVSEPPHLIVRTDSLNVTP